LNLDTLNDNELITMIAGSHSEAAHQALGILYDRYGRLVYTIAYHVVGDSETAEEITQDAFVRVWEGASTYRGEIARVTSWLVSIARHRAIDELRRRSSRPEQHSVVWPDDPDQEGSYPFPVLDNPEEAVGNAIQFRGVRRMVAMLPPEQRQVLGLAYFKGMSHSEIAEHLGEPLGTVKSRIRMAMQRLRDAMVEHGIVDR
jgi:RNA polymerase sigma-70 factor (ECF subfamily)